METILFPVIQHLKIGKVEIHCLRKHNYKDYSLKGKEISSLRIKILVISRWEGKRSHQRACRGLYAVKNILFHNLRDTYNGCLSYKNRLCYKFVCCALSYNICVLFHSHKVENNENTKRGIGDRKFKEVFCKGE